MHRLTKGFGESTLVVLATLILSTCAWLVAMAHGPVATMFLRNPVGIALGDACFYVSLPGWFLAVGITGYDSGATILV